MADRHENTLVSVVIPFRNAAAFLEDCCDSVKTQTYNYWEAILIDDNSSDESAEIATRFATMDSRFRVIKSDRLTEDQIGPWLPRNRGVREAKGQYVAFLDADDLWLPEKLDHQLYLLEHGQYDLCICPYYRFSDQTGCITELRKPPTRHWPALLKLINPIPLSAIIIKRELITTGFRAVSHEDYDAWRRLFASHNIRYASCDRALVAYRIHRENLTGSWWRKLRMRRAQQEAGGRSRRSITLPLFLLIHGLYFMRSVPWRLQSRSIKTMGFAHNSPV
jgi:teichuronic acid biosynthesis glycosyltransferase TuaG